MTAALFLLVSAGFAETRFDAAQLVPLGARSGHFFDSATTGSLVLTIPPAQGTSPEPLSIRRFALCEDDEWTTTAVYDPATTFTLTLPVGGLSVGPHYVVVRALSSHRMRWSYFCILPPPGYTPPRGEISSSSLTARWHKLALRKLDAFFDSDTTGTWLANDPDTDYHWMREDAYYAVALLDDTSTESHTRANAILKTIAGAQDRVSTSPTYGWFFVNGADMRTPQNASTFFIPPVLAHLCLSPPPTLAPDTLEEIRTALWYNIDGVASKFTFPPFYENFYFMGTATLALGAQIFHNDPWAQAARTKLEAAHQFFLARGASVEWASPVYTAVSDWALGLIAEHAADPQTRDLANYLRHRLWLDVAVFFNPASWQQIGPFSRVYEDGLRGGAGLTAFALGILLEREGFDAPERLAEMVAAHHSLDINPCYWIAKRAKSIAPVLRSSFLQSRPTSWTVRQRNFTSDATAFVTPSFALGSLSSTTNTTILGHEGLVAQIYETSAPTGYSAFFARLGPTQNDAITYSSGDAFNMFGFQHEGRVLWLADRTFASFTPSAPQVIHAIVSDSRFSQWEDWRVDGTPVQPPAAVPLGSMITARRAGTYLLAIPLYASALGTRNREAAILQGDGYTALALFGLDAPVPEPLASKRFEAAWGLAMAEASTWSSYDDFVADALTQTSTEVTFTASTISLEWDWHATMTATFSRTTRDWLSRRVNGNELEFPLLESPIAAQTPNTSAMLRDLFVSDLPPYSWLIYPIASDRALIANPGPATSTPTTNWTTEPMAIPAYGFAEIQRGAPASVGQWELYASPLPLIAPWGRALRSYAQTPGP
jgi:hypothetical protein